MSLINRIVLSLSVGLLVMGSFNGSAYAAPGMILGSPLPSGMQVNTGQGMVLNPPRVGAVTVTFAAGQSPSGFQNQATFEHHDGDNLDSSAPTQSAGAYLRIWLHGQDAVNATGMQLQMANGAIVASTYNAFFGTNSCNSNVIASASHCWMNLYLFSNGNSNTPILMLPKGTYTLYIAYRDGHTKLHTFNVVSYGMIPAEGMHR